MTDQPTEEQLSVRTVILTAFEECESADPGVVADWIIRHQDPSERLAFYAKLLRREIHAQAGLSRANAFRSSPAAPRGRSRVDLVRSWWASQLDQRIAVTENDWKFLRELTRSDVLTIAEARRSKAEGLYAAALRMERLAEAMAECGAETVEQIPEHLAEAAWKTSEAAA